ncbi:hypothetical protein [Streptomyces sp. NPDC007346]|uniref:hypothetical protein n=1 Tax=Streptomyces sp. NPDC007346 TaxID=3154682 RepID=UPI003451AC9E
MLRAIMWVVLTGVTIAYVLRYAGRVREDPGRSLLAVLAVLICGFVALGAVWT